MGFGFTEAQEMFRREVASFAQKELASGAKQRAKEEFINRRLHKRLGDMRFLGLNLPEKYGGQPADYISLGIVIEELSKVDSSISLYLPIEPVLCAILLQCPEDLQQEWLPHIISGDKILCFALTEPDCGSDAAALKTRAVRGGTFMLSMVRRPLLPWGHRLMPAWSLPRPTLLLEQRV